MPKKDIKEDLLKESKNSRRTTEPLSQSRDSSKNNQNNKKVYAPNLNVVRNKNLDLSLNEIETKKDGNSRGRRGKNAKQPYNKRVNQNLVQTRGFLSEGFGEIPVQKSEYSGGGGGSSKVAGTVEVMQKPRLVKREIKCSKEELETEQKMLDKLLEAKDPDDVKACADDVVPINLNHFNSAFKKDNVDDVKTKLESMSFCGNNESTDNNILNGNAAIKTEQGTEINTERYYRIEKLFHPPPYEIALFKMPDMLPQKLPDSDDINNKDEEDDAPKPITLSSLEDFSEGLIGKLVRYRSGKAKLLIGDYLYDIATENSKDCLQNVVAINSNAHEKSASMYSLGEVHSKYDVIPDWNWLLDSLP